VGWKVKPFHNPREAIESMSVIHYDAVFCDENLRGASIPGFLVWTRRIAPHISFYLISSTGDTGGQRDGINAVLAYPLTEETTPLPPGQTRAPTVTDTRTAPLSGNTSLLSLPNLLETIGMSRQAGVLELEAFSQRGRIFMHNGVLQHAETFAPGSSQSGLPALANLLMLDTADFKVLPYTTPARTTINLPAVNALTEAMRLADETKRYQSLVTDIRQACPHATDIAVGYLLAVTPREGHGASAELFRIAQDLLKEQRTALGGKPLELFFASANTAVALGVFGDDNLLVARAPARVRVPLYDAVRRSLDAA
jgi:hypothetical protein